MSGTAALSGGVTSFNARQSTVNLHSLSDSRTVQMGLLKVEPEYWERETQIAVRNQHVAARSLETAREWYNQSGGLHTLQRLYGCDLLSDGSVRGSRREGYDGRDFISFDLESGRFMAADNIAEITRRRWEQEGTVAERWTNYLKHECPECLRKYVGYGQKELERKGGSRIPVGIWDLGMEDLGTP
ncbi:class I histocompatibility antigen, F10 alpha chain-like [Passer montanus]|uniref:class I histocompatibility antigen, F10 alpha chain-like n=1 Tax=Passer montanus TaxID=9160 RepID=UPI0019603283|nr:class I histocompatibility antigen, F10 alpha chain-like [Passer montanus]